MPLDPERLQLTRQWLTKAREDLDIARFLLERKPPFLDYVMFHCQQAAEKALKAFLTWHDIRFRKTHDISELADLCSNLDSALGTIAEPAEKLSEYAIVSRYPEGWETPTASEGRRSLRSVSLLYEEILKRLPKEAHPKHPKKNKTK